jgi:hypothetical protein
MKVEEYLYMCLTFSIVFAVHSAIAAIARKQSSLALAASLMHTPMLRVNINFR